MKENNVSSKMSKLHSSLIGLCSSFLLVLVAFFAYTGISLGWFASNNSTSASGLQISVPTDASAVAEVVFYNASGISDEGVITFDFTDGKSETALPKYDILDGASSYILMKVTVSENYILKISTDTDYILDKSRPLLGGNGIGEDYSNWLSSIIFFERVSPTLTYADEGDESSNIVSGAVTLSEDNQRSFVLKADYTFDGSQEFSYSCTGGDSLYIVIGYDDDLVNRIFSENIGNSNIDGLSDVKYVNDCRFIVTLGGAE